MSRQGGKKKKRDRGIHRPDQTETGGSISAAAPLQIPVVKTPAWQGGLAAFLFVALLFMMLFGLESLKELAASLPAVP